jgi:hypothetical protein
MVLPSMEPLCAALAPLIYKSSKRLVTSLVLKSFPVDLKLELD